jgi:hypothetical protein
MVVRVYYFSQLLVESQLECGWFFPSKVGKGNIHISILVTAWLLVAWQDERSMRQDVSDVYVLTLFNVMLTPPGSAVLN